MTLKEKFKPFVFYVADSFNVARENDKEKNSTECENIADDYAIEFVEWLDLDETQDLIYSLQMVGELPKIPKNKELLEVFKNQKGL